MNAKKILPDDRGSVSVEYVIFVSSAAILLIVGVGLLFNAMSDFFARWATYFGG